MNAADEQYIALCERILTKGARKDDRTGTGTLSVFGAQMRFDLTEGFPLLTTKRLPFRVIAEELLWFLRGSTDLKDLVDRNVNIWTPDGYRVFKSYGGSETYEEFEALVRQDDGYFDLGPIYGAQWRSWQPAELVFDHFWDDGREMLTDRTIDQIANVIESIRVNPDSRRHVVSAWNVGELEDMALPPCHVLFQFYVADGRLSCQLYQRSADVFLGLPFNIASYALLTHMIADITGLEVDEFIHTIGDAHIYLNHIDQVKTQIRRDPRPLPSLFIRHKVDDPADYTFEDFVLTDYKPQPAIKGEVSVG